MKDEIIQLKQAIDDGQNNGSIWLPLHFPKMGTQVGIGKKILTLIGGGSGTGKTAFTDLAYILGPYSWYLKHKDNTDIKLRWIYRSMERSQTYKLAKWTSLILYLKYKYLIDVPTLLRWGTHKNKMPQEVYEKVTETYNLLDEMLDYVEIVDGSINPTGIYKHVQEYAKTVGKEELIPYTTKEGIQRTKKVYKQNNKNLITIIIIDHIGRLSAEKDAGGQYLSANGKPLLDRMSSYCSSEFRDYYGFSPVIVSQFNRGIEDTQRRTKTELSPLPSDFRGTSVLYDDCDVALALYNPYKLGDDNNLDYNIPKFVNPQGYNRFRSCYILKNSYGADDLAFGFNFIGEVGNMIELPKANEISDYNKYANPEVKIKV